MIIETERLILREYTYDDSDSLYEILSDKETMKHYPKPFDEEKLEVGFNGILRIIQISDLDFGR